MSGPSRSSAPSAGSAAPALLDVETLLAAGTAHMAHRGNGSVFPDNSLEGFEYAMQSGHNMLDGGDLWYGTDGTLLNHHNSPAAGELLTPNALQYSGKVENLGAAAFKQFKHRIASENAVMANLPDAKTCTFEDVCALVKKYGGVVITPELKSQSNAAAMAKLIATVKKYGIDKSVIVQSFTATDLLAAHNAGLKTAWLNNTLPGTPLATCQANGIDFFSYDFTNASFTPTALQTLYDGGVRLAPWTFNRRSEVTTEAARVGRPLSWVASWYGTFTGGVIPAGNADPFGGMIPFRGQIPSGANRGVFTRQGKLSIINGAGVHQGWASRDTPNQASIQVLITYETIAAADSLGAYVLFGLADDRVAIFNSAPQGGYLAKVQGNGTISWGTLIGSTFATKGTIVLTGANAGGFPAGGFITLKMEMQAAATKLTAVETGQTSNLANETTYRGGHIVFGNSAGDREVSFSQVAIT